MKKKYYLLALVFLLTNLFNLYSAQGVNLALGKTVTSSSVDNSALPNSNLTDGNFSTVARTGSSQVPPNAEWFLVDLGQDYFIQNITLGAVVPDNTRSRRFLIVTYPTSLNNLGNNPATYFASGVDNSAYNRFVYSQNIAGNTFGNNSSNPNIPGLPGETLGPAFNQGIININVGIHKARYIMVLNLQQAPLEFTELQVTSGSMPVRNFINGNFEQGSSVTSGGQAVPEGLVDGWSTTEGVNRNVNNSLLEGGIIEFWRSGFNGVSSYEGLFFIEINASNNAKLEQQPICVLPNETFNFSFAHRGRFGIDVMHLVIDDVDVAELKDSNAQTGTHTGTILSGGVSASLTLSKDQTTATGWTRYFGSWKNTSGISKQITFGFRAVSTANGNLSVGNFLDDVQISALSAIATFDKLSPKGDESMGTANLPKILINGPLASPRTIQISITGGTAVRGVDYTTTPATGNLSITIPAGNYDGTDATAINLSSVIQINQDFISEGDETIILQLIDPGTGDLQLADASSCQGAVITSTYAITDFVCYKTPVTTGVTLTTNMGISSFNRAGNSDTEWPKVRKGGYIALESSTKGLVVTRTTKGSILDPVVGMIIYETNDKCLSIYTSTGWKCYQSASCPD